jgi:hypothetical protein
MQHKKATAESLTEAFPVRRSAKFILASKPDRYEAEGTPKKNTN